MDARRPAVAGAPPKPRAESYVPRGLTPFPGQSCVIPSARISARARRQGTEEVKSDVATRASRSFAFGPFLLVPERQLLLRDDQPVRIGGRALDLLIALVARPGELVSKSELIAQVWPDTAVDESNLKVNMAVLRRALEDGPSTQYIATVVGRGYRFVAPVQGAEPVALPAESSRTPVPSHNLPTSTTRTFGRDAAIASIRSDLDRSRLVSIVGPGGVGKTTVAIAVAEAALGAFADGVWFVDLVPLKDPDRTPHAIAAALGVQAQSADMIAALCAFLRTRQTLLVLDNCEHVIDGVASCADRILASAVGVRILFTSREPLRMAKERVRRLSGLDSPPDSRSLDARTALEFPAVQLFVERAMDGDASYQLSDADAPLVARICRKLDGLALAIELAATRVAAFGVAGVLRQLDDRLRSLGGWRTGPERHRTLTATLDWSYNLLDEREAALFRAVCVFPGAFDLDGAVAVSAAGSVDVLEAVASLAAKSLLAVQPSGGGVTCRLLETARAYAIDRLQSSGEELTVRRRHAEHVCAVLDRAKADWPRLSACEWSATYAPITDDLRGALAWAASDATDRLLPIRLTVAGTLLWEHLSLTEECRVHVSRALAELDGAGLAGTSTEMELQLALAGATMLTRGLVPEVLAALRRTLEIAERIGDLDHRLRGLRMLGSYWSHGGHSASAIETYEMFIAVASEHDPSALSSGETHLGIAEVFAGRLLNARRRMERLHRDSSLRFDDSRLTRFQYDRHVDVGIVLAYAQWLTGFPDTAAETAVATVERALATKHHISLSNALAVAACPVFFFSRRYDECARYLAMLEEQVRQHGIVIWSPTARFYRGALACAGDHVPPQGIDDLERAVAEFRSINQGSRRSWVLAVLADALARGGRVADALPIIAEALEWAQTHGERWCRPEVSRIQALILLALGRTDEAEAALVDAVSIARDIGGLSWRLRAGSDLARLWRSRGRSKEARELLLPIYSEFTEGLATHDLVAAAELIADLRRD
jgi:predicted ATPase/DNA-binding winged helix-turn-helix (wHTH) protein